VECPGAPPTRLKVGDIAVVISDPDPVRARSAPPDGEIIDLLYSTYSLPVVGGPVCADNLLWWEVELRDQRRAWVAEGAQSGDGEIEYFIDLRIAATTTAVELPQLNGGPLDPGVYFLQITSPETAREGYQPLKHFLVVATANLALKMSMDSATIWATNVQTGEPIPNAPVYVYDDSFRVLAQGTTDADGLARLDVPRLRDLYQPRAVVLRSDSDFGMAVSTWTDGIDPWQFGQNYEFYPQRYRAYMYTDRPIYRPGQPVYFRGVVRLKDDVTYTPPDLQTVPVKIFNDQGEVIYEKDLPLSPFGTFSGQYDLGDDTSLGYQHRVELPSDHPYQTEAAT
jgi:hypothetical protein